MKRILLSLILAVFATSLMAQDVFSIKINEVLANGTLLRGVSNRFIEQVEFYNTSVAPVDIGGCTLTDSDGADPFFTVPKFTFPFPTTIPAMGFLVVNLDPDLQFGLKDNGDALYFRNPDKLTIDQIGFGAQLQNKSIGRYPDGVGDWTLTETTFGSTNVPIPLGNPAVVKINEWLATGTDFVELYNPSGSNIDLGNLRIADAGVALLSAVWDWPTIPPLTFIGTGRDAYFVLEAGASGSRALPFGLDKDGDAFYLAGQDFTLIDSVSILQPKDVSSGRIPDGSTNIVDFPKRVTKGRPNFGLLTQVWVNEILTHTDPPLEDAVELFNPGDAPVDISGWYMTDEFSNPDKYIFPAGTVVPAHGYYVAYEYQFHYTLNSAHGATNYIFEIDPVGGNQLSYLETKIPAAPNGVSYGRVVNSDGDVDLVPLQCRSFGNDYNLRPGNAGLIQFRQGTGKTNDCTPVWGPVIISEVMYHPPDLVLGSNNVLDEYIEIRNLTKSKMPLYDPAHRENRWHIDISDNLAFNFASTDVLPPLGYMLIVGFDPVANPTQLAAFRSRYPNIPSTVAIRGPYANKLGNGDDIVALIRPDRPQTPPHPDAGYVPQLQVDRVHYEAKAPWPIDSNGNGKSLQRVNYPGYGDEPKSWFDDTPTPGLPNAQKITITSQPAGYRVLVGSTAILSVAAEVAGSNSAPKYQWTFRNKPITTNVTATTPNLAIPNFTVKHGGPYTCIVSNYSGKYVTATATLTPVLPVVIKKGLPESITKPAGTKSLILKPIVTGTKPFTYQWFKDGAIIEGQTGPSLKLLNLTAESAGTYKVQVSNGPSAAESETVLEVTQ